MILAVAAVHAAETPAPAASLLLPRFEVSLESRSFNTTFTVTNAGAVPQIIRVTFFTDRGYAVLWYSTAIYAHETMGIDLGSILTRGRFEQRSLPPSPANPRLAANASQFCSGEHAGEMSVMLMPLVYMLTSGCVVADMMPCRASMGHRHAHAIGYVMIDVVRHCGTDMEPPRLDEAALTGTFEQRGPGGVIASGPLAPLPLPSSATLRVPRGKHDVIVWRAPHGAVKCGGGEDVLEVRHIDAWRAQTLTFRGEQVWAMVTAPMPPDPGAAPPPPDCPGVPVF